MNYFKKLKMKKALKQEQAKKLQQEKILQNEYKKRFPDTNIIIKDLTLEELDYLDLGAYSYSAPLTVDFIGENNSSLKIGRFCSIASEVKILLGGQHFYKGLTTFAIYPYIEDNYRKIYPKGIPSIKAKKCYNIKQESALRQGGGGFPLK